MWRPMLLLQSDLSPLAYHLVCERRTRADQGRGPLADGTYRTAIQAFGDRKLRRTVRADSLSLESVEWLTAAPAFPVVADWWPGFARRTSEPLPARQLGET